MADAAVRVDIVSGKNTVISSVELTEGALKRLMGTTGAATAGFESLSRKGLKSVEIGFRQLAFQAAGVPGPMGKIAEGALLLGGGGGALLGVAVAAGAAALAWKAMTKHANELKDAIKGLNDLLPRNDKGAEEIAKLWKEYGDQLARASRLERQAAEFQGAGSSGVAKRLQLEAAAIRDKAAALKQYLDAVALSVPAMGGTGKGTGGADGPGKSILFSSGYNPEIIAQAQEQSVALRTAIVGPLAEMPDMVGAAFDGVRDEMIRGLEITSDVIDGINTVLFNGFVDLAANLAAALGNGDSFGDVILAALGQMMQDIGRMLITAGLALTKLIPALLNFLTSGPAMIAAGVILSAVGAAASKRAQGGHVSPSAATGGVSGGGYERDQRQIAAAGTVTVRMPRDGLIRASDPVFQEFLAQVIKEAKGRNVVFA